MGFFSRSTKETVSHALRPPCSVCGVPSVHLDLFETGGEWRLRYHGLGGSNAGGDPITAERAHTILAAFSEPYEPAKIRLAELYDDAGFCRECEKFYCETHWQVSSTGGGQCPAGHFKSLDPHWSPAWDD